MLLAQPQRFQAVGGLGHDCHLGVALEQAAQAAADDAVIVSQQHAHA